MPDGSKPCPICSGPAPISERYSRTVCAECAALAKAPDGRPVQFFNVDLSGGFAGHYSDDYTPYGSHMCVIRGVECWAEEGRFGGIVIQPVGHWEPVKGR